MFAWKLSAALVVTFFSIALLAQSNSGQQNTIPGPAKSQPLTIRGCLTGSAGTYVLVADSKGTAYKLVGNPELDRMIRHEVEVTGQEANTTENQSQTSSSGEASAQEARPTTLQVSSIREVSDTCSAKSSQ